MAGGFAEGVLRSRHRTHSPRSVRPLVTIERVSGLNYAKQEAENVARLISQADALLEGQDADFYGAFVAAFRAFLGSQNRT